MSATSSSTMHKRWVGTVPTPEITNEGSTQSSPATSRLSLQCQDQAVKSTLLRRHLRRQRRSVRHQPWRSSTALRTFWKVFLLIRDCCMKGCSLRTDLASRNLVVLNQQALSRRFKRLLQAKSHRQLTLPLAIWRYSSAIQFLGALQNT